MTIKEGDTTIRRVEHCMGAWKWGYPRGYRRAVVQYTAVVIGDGTLRWKSTEELHDGITAACEPWCKSTWPVAFDHPVGSIHMERCSPDEEV